MIPPHVIQPKTEPAPNALDPLTLNYRWGMPAEVFQPQPLVTKLSKHARAVATDQFSLNVRAFYDTIRKTAFPPPGQDEIRWYYDAHQAVVLATALLYPHLIGFNDDEQLQVLAVLQLIRNKIDLYCTKPGEYTKVFNALKQCKPTR